MDTAFYYIKCKGEEKGPYRFYQLQQFKTEEEMTAADFTPDEWEYFSNFVATGEIPEGATAFFSKQTYIRRVTGDKKLAALARQRSVLRLLTWFSYGIGLLGVVGGLLQGTQDYLLRAAPMFYLGLLFCVGLGHVCIDRAVRAKISRSPSIKKGTILLWYLLGLVPIASVIGITAAIAQFFLGGMGFSAEQVYEVGKYYLAAAAVIGIYRPFFLHALHVDHHLGQPARHSLPWLISLVIVLLLMFLYFAKDFMTLPPKIEEVRAWVFTTEIPRPEETSNLRWQYQIRLRDNGKLVTRRLGEPQEVIGSEWTYRRAGLRVAFTENDQVAKIRFFVPEGELESTALKSRIIGGASLKSTKAEIEKLFGATPTAVFNDYISQTCVWDQDGYRISACFWTQDHRRDGKNVPAGSLKWFEVATLE